MQLPVFRCQWPEYQLVDSGEGRKLERFGEVLLIRDEPKAWWKPSRPEAWREAQAEFADKDWTCFRPAPPRQWQLPLFELTLEARLTDMSKHVGVFPEQEPHWCWLRQCLKKAPQGRQPRVLNLFGYTGVASLVAAGAGAHVTHVDASKPAIAWGRHQQSLSGLDEAPIRWLLDDAFKFVQREQRRGNHYDIILLDPPSYGRGPRKEIWKVESMIGELLEGCGQLLSPQALGMVLTMYNLEASATMLRNLMRQTLGKRAGELVAGELALQPQYGEAWLPLSLFARWQAA